MHEAGKFDAASAPQMSSPGLPFCCRSLCVGRLAVAFFRRDVQRVSRKNLEKLTQILIRSSFQSETCRMGSVDDRKSSVPESVTFLHDWYLIKSPKEHLGKRLAVGGISSKGAQGVEIFYSAPIIQRINAFQLRAADGRIILLSGLIDGQRTCDNGFPGEVPSLFQIGFPFTWEILANIYISKGATSCSSLEQDSDFHEVPMHSAGRARRVRILTNDEKGSKNDSVSEQDSDRWTRSSFARKFEDKADSFFRDPALCLGSDAKNFNSSNAQKLTEKAIIGKHNVSSSGSALGSILEFGDGGRVYLEEGDRCIKAHSDEAITSQTSLNMLKSISIDTLNKDMTSVSMDDSAQLASNPVRSDGYEIAYAVNNDLGKGSCNPLKCLQCSGDMSSGNIPVKMFRDENDNVEKDLTIQKDSDSNLYLSESGRVMPMCISPECTRSVSSPVVITDERVPCLLGKDTSINAKNVVFLGNFIRGRATYAAKLAIERCKTRSNLKNVNDEHVESESNNLIKNPMNRDDKCQLDLSNCLLSQQRAEMKTWTPTTTGIDALSVGLSYQRATRSRVRSCSSGNLQKKEKGCSSLKDGHNQDIPVLNCPEDAVLNTNGGILGAPKFGLGETKDKIILNAQHCDSGHRTTRSRAMSSNLKSLRKEEQKGCSSPNDATNKDVTVSVNCSKEAVLDVGSHKSSASELGVVETKNLESVDAKTLECDRLSTSLSTMSRGSAKCRLQYDHATDPHIPHTGECLLLAARRYHFQDLVSQRPKVSDDLKKVGHRCSEVIDTRKGKKEKKHVQHVHRPFIPSNSADKSSEPGKSLNLKISSSGRLIVPPLAHWRNAQIVYDLEGRITSVFDGSQIIKRPGTHSHILRTRSSKQQRRA